MTLRIAFSNSEELSWDFDGDCVESVDCFWQDGHFNYIDPANPRAWQIFPFSEVFFDFLLQIKQICSRLPMYFIPGNSD